MITSRNSLVGRTTTGLTLTALGGLLLLQALGVIGDALNPLWPLLFATAGLAFVSLVIGNRADAWAFVPGLALLGLAGSGALQKAAPSLDTWGGSLFLGGIALGFLALYATSRATWWAVIPAGVLLTLASTSGLSSAYPGTNTGGAFFLGLALTFAAVYLLPAQQPAEGARSRRTWALIVALPPFVLAVVIFTAAAPALGYIAAITLIGGGLSLALRPVRAGAHAGPRSEA